MFIEQNELNISFNKPTGCGNILNFIANHHDMWKWEWQTLSDFEDFNWRSRSFILTSNCRVQPNLLKHQIQCHPDQLKSVQENGADRFGFPLTLHQDQSHWKWQKLYFKGVEVSCANQQDRYERMWLKVYAWWSVLKFLASKTASQMSITDSMDL